MLVFMELVLFGVRWEPQEKWRVNIIVMIFDIGIAMVQNIVLQPPDLVIGTDQIDCVSHEFVDRLVPWKRTMYGVVHHAHANTCHAKSTQNVQSKQQWDTCNGWKNDGSQRSEKQQ